MEKAAVMTHRVIALLDRDELEFLDRLGKDSLFSTGHKLSYNQIVKGLVDVAREAGLSGEGIGTPEAFKEKLIAQIKAMMDMQARKEGR